MEVSVENKMPVPNAMSSSPEAIEMLHYTLSLSRASFSDWHCYLAKPSQLLIAFQHISPMEVSAENKMPVPNAMSSNPEAIEMLHYTLSLSRASFSDWHCFRPKPVTYFLNNFIKFIIRLSFNYKKIWFCLLKNIVKLPTDLRIESLALPTLPFSQYHRRNHV